MKLDNILIGIKRIKDAPAIASLGIVLDHVIVAHLDRIKDAPADDKAQVAEELADFLLAISNKVRNISRGWAVNGVVEGLLGEKRTMKDNS